LLLLKWLPVGNSRSLVYDDCNNYRRSFVCLQISANGRNRWSNPLINAGLFLENARPAARLLQAVTFSAVLEQVRRRAALVQPETEPNQVAQPGMV
jgi:hypothetical protein